MADSDDEYDRKRRDKFRGERNEYREGRREERPRRDDWTERDQWARGRTRGEYRDYRGRDSRYSPVRSHDISPPVKRMRTDWEDRRYGHDSGYNNYNSWGNYDYSSSHSSSYGNHSSNQKEPETGPTQPPMLSFKAFLASQDDAISDEEAIRKYNEYKLEFKRQQLNEFFMAHREEEWFKVKYHPEECVKRKEEQMAALKRRVDVFTEFWEGGRIDGITIDADQSEKLVRLLDAVVIKLEGGSDFDLKVLDEPPPPEKPSESEEARPYILGEDNDKQKSRTAASTPDSQKDPSQPLKLAISSEQVELQRKAKEFLRQKSGEEGGTKRKREYDSESGSESGEEADEPAPPGMEESNAGSESKGPEEKGEDVEEGEDGGEDEENDKSEKSPSASASPKKVEGDKSAENKDEEAANDEAKEKEKEPQKERSVSPEGKADKEDDEERKDDEDDAEKEKDPKPHPLHKTASIFLRNLAPSITKQEVEAMCKRYPGFLRVAIADPQPERRWFRRGWVTFERSVNIKEICWNLNNIRLRDCELGAIVNRDLSRRIRTVNGVASHKQVVRHDIKLAARIIQNLDAKWELWGSQGAAPGNDQQEKQDQEPGFGGLASRNPILHNITDYLIEEASAEEEELLGHSADQEEGQVNEDGATIERDDELIKVLDRLLLYLRIVHSVDYYNHAEYPSEDEMPNRCGIMHARGIPPSSKVTPPEVSDYCSAFEQKVASFLQPSSQVVDDECKKLGLKNPEAEVEKFITANTQELAKDKWLCPLSGKKFKGPEYVRKHIFNKHGEKVEEVKKEVEYFNNYLRDPRRPQLAEHPGNKQPARGESAAGERAGTGFEATQYQQQYNYGNYGGGGRHSGGGYGGSGYSGMGYGRDQYQRDPYREQYGGRSRGGGGYNRNRMDYRPMVQYRDLDAPRDTDEF